MEKEKKETLIANSHYVITSNSDRFVVMPALCKLRARLLCSRAFSLFKRYLFAWLSRYITSHVRLPSRDVVRGGEGGRWGRRGQREEMENNAESSERIDFRYSLANSLVFRSRKIADTLDAEKRLVHKKWYFKAAPDNASAWEIVFE